MLLSADPVDETQTSRLQDERYFAARGFTVNSLASYAGLSDVIDNRLSIPKDTLYTFISFQCVGSSISNIHDILLV